MNRMDTLTPAPPSPPTPMMLLQTAMDQGADIGKLEKLMELQERWQANEARMAFVTAMAKFKENPPKIVKDKTVSFKDTRYKHAGLDQVATLIGQALSAVGISHRWEIRQGEGNVEVDCILTHVGGHSERTTLRAPVDSSGGKNQIQGVGSAVSYLQRYTLLAATGLATGEDDNDGNGEKTAGAIMAIQSAKNAEELRAVYERELKLATDARDIRLQRSIIAAKDARKKELS